MTDKNDIYLQNIPMLKENLDYTVDGNIVSINIHNNHLIQRVFRKFGLGIKEKTKIQLDLYSSFVFLQIDGQKNIYQIGQILLDEFGEDCQPLYERLVTFIDFLEDDRRWILFKNKL